jgi:MFS family permease
VNAARRLAFARLISLSGGSAAYIALVAAIYGATGSALWISAAIFSSVVASVIAAPFAGWLGDRYARRRVMIATDLAAGGVSLAMAATSHHPAVLVVLVGLSSIAQAPFEPASAAALPSLVTDELVGRANALVAATGSAAYLVGPLVGGVVLAAGASPATVFVVDAATFLVSAAAIAGIRQSFGRGSTETHPGALAGAKLILREAALLAPVAAGMVSLLGIGIADVASYPLSVHLGGGAGGYGAMTALLGGGGLLGAALAGRVVRRRPRSLLAGAFLAGAIGLGIASAAPVVVVALVGMSAAGGGRGLADVAAVTLIQRHAPDEVRSRVFAAQEGAAHIAFSVSAFSGGLLVSAGGSRFAFAAAAAASLCAAGVASFGRSD